MQSVIAFTFKCQKKYNYANCKWVEEFALFFCCVGTKNAKKIPSKQKRKVNISKLKDEKRKKIFKGWLIIELWQEILSTEKYCAILKM